MIKKMMLLAVSVAALAAFALPAAASADTLKEGGTALKPGTLFTATSANLTTVTGVGTLECEKVALHLELVSNTPATIEGVGPATTTGCKTNTGRFVTVTDGTVGEFTMAGGSGVANAFFASDIYLDSSEATLLAQCSFAGEVEVTNVGGGAIEVAGPELGGPCGNGSMSGEFSLETSGGAALELTNP